MMRYICSVLLLLLCISIHAQNNFTDSLKKYSYSELQQKFYQYNNDDKEKAKQVSKYYLQKAKTENETDQIEEGYVLAHLSENQDISLRYLDSLLVFTKNSTKNTYPARVYLLKGNLYYKFDNQSKALENYLLALKYAKEKKNKRQIAFADINIAYLNNYIGKHEEAAKTLRYYLRNAKYLNENELGDIHSSLADVYLDYNNLDSANVLIKEGVKLYQSKDDYKYYRYLYLSGLYNFKLKNYKQAINILSKCKDYFLSHSNDLNINYTLLYLGKSYDALGQKDIAAKNFIEIDSIIQKDKSTFPELREIYPFLIEYYKELQDKEKQLYYIDRFLEVDKVLDSQFRYISRELPKKYDAPNLLKEKESIINSLENRRNLLYISVSILILGLSLLGYFYYKSKKSEREFKKRAQDLLHSVYEKDKIITQQKIQVETQFEKKIERPIQNTPVEIIEEDTKEKPSVSGASAEVMQAILQELSMFESKEQFLKKGISLSSLAKKIKTNSKYLSETINTHKEKNFAGYLNDLRIDYAISRLAKDRKFRSYKIPFIAEELGYNNEQAFTLAFKKRTGTPLSVYLKEIEKSEN
ncbi:helix-turn-helix domain-containing protein [Chryseobacterium sp. JUb7]|uniref:helix-turn-helix domain-containing protein n=1 Tax=Chryseobacterium sp. JUb7 TaxID=2940599 RepID=UPI002166CFF8|nr:helix-turn-helix domain-containing protein [Chryseobacterium sp. JUb7]MCS3532553.1 AraC-like DNA-binding protein [Chryseobacterium sp. JUb7]